MTPAVAMPPDDRYPPPVSGGFGTAGDGPRPETLGEIKLPLDSIRGDNGPGITVELIEGQDIYLTFEPETTTDESVRRSLSPEEARALAAVFVHFANEAER